MCQTFTMQAKFLRRLPNPFGDYINGIKSPECYEVLVDIKDLPTDMNFQTNPRFQNMKTKVVKKIKESLQIDDNSFHLKNRGILLSAKSVKFNNITGDLSLEFEDPTVHGNVDGGHTYHAILEVRDNISHTHFVKLEIMTGIENIFELVAAARNTSVQVQDKAIAELSNKFQFVKDFIANEPFSGDIAYKDNDDKDIEIIYIISLLYMFNIDKFNSPNVAPVNACTATQNCMKDFLEVYDKTENDLSENPYYKMKNIIIDIFMLHDELQKNINNYYRQTFGNGARYGQVKGVIVGGTTSTFYRYDIEHTTPKGLIFPILGSLRALVEEENGFYRWKSDPFEYLNRLGKNLVGETIERHRSLGNNPASVGKDSNHWKQLYRLVLLETVI